MSVAEAEASDEPGAEYGSAVLRAVAVTKRYGAGPASRCALEQVDLDITGGRFVAIVGPSGSGKSTLLHLFGALDVPTEGDVWFGEQLISTLDEAQRTEVRRHSVGFVFQQYNLLGVLSGSDNVALPLVISRTPEPARRERVERALALVGLSRSVASQRPAQMSGGEQQRIAIARALVTEPTVILADEPTGALDSDTGRDVLRVLRDICDGTGRTVVLATHDPAAAAMADEVIRLRDGRVVDRHPVEPLDVEAVFRSGHDESGP